MNPTSTIPALPAKGACAATKAYGQRAGNRSICNRELTAEESLERFVGTICYSRYFG